MTNPFDRRQAGSGFGRREGPVLKQPASKSAPDGGGFGKWIADRSFGTVDIELAVARRHARFSTLAAWMIALIFGTTAVLSAMFSFGMIVDVSLVHESVWEAAKVNGALASLLFVLGFFGFLCSRIAAVLIFAVLMYFLISALTAESIPFLWATCVGGNLFSAADGIFGSFKFHWLKKSLE